MARRRRSDPVLQKLRQLASRGRRTAAGELLEETLRLNPNHTKAREEYSRYLTNKPFTFEVKDYEELQSIISEFLSSPHMLTSMRSSSIKRLRNRVRFLQRAQDHMLSVMEKKVLAQLRSSITRELQRRRKPMGKIFIAMGVVMVILLITAGVVFFLWKRARSAAETLDLANAGNISRVAALNLLQIHDTGLNRTMDRRVGVEADNLRAYLRAQEQRARELDAILQVIERGEQTVVGQGVRRRANIERKLKALGQDAAPYLARWGALCNAEKDALNQQRLTLSEELLLPLPPQPNLKGDIEEDLAVLSQRQKFLQERINIYEDAGEALNLPRNLIIPAQLELLENKHILAEIKQFKNLLQLLPAAHDYETYRSRLNNWVPKHYALAVQMLGIVKKLPALNKVQGRMQEYGQNVKPGLLLAARKSLLEGKPSFSADFPASREQLHLLNELLANSALSVQLFEHIDTATNERAISEVMPEVRYGRSCFPRSMYDPERDNHNRKAVEWHNPHAVVSRVIDPRPLHNQLGLGNRTGFYSIVNLPRMLTDVFRIEGPAIPALARAYVLHYLIKANNAWQDNMLTGMRYAPKTRQALQEFEKLRKSCDIRLDGNCWLQYTAKHAAAERKFAKWFAQHRELNFQEELKQNLGALMNVTPRFCGYIDERAEARLFEPAKEGQLIWYDSETGGMTATAWGDELNKPLRLSPIFTMEKQY